MNSAREKALYYLGRFSRTEKQLTDYLKRKQFTPEQISDALAFVREHKFVNDTSYAEAFIRTKIHHGDGPLKIKQMLFQKGISPQKADELLREMYPLELQIEKASALLQKRVGSRIGISAAPREKLIRAIASRGFPRYVIIQLFKRS